MKNIFLSFIVTMMFFLTAFKVAEVYQREMISPLNVDTRPAIEVIMPRLETPKIEIDLKDHYSFLKKIGHYESSNDYSKVNRWGYMGRYQFGRKTLRGLGYDVSKSEFLNSPTLQEKAMMDLLEHNQKILRKYIDYWDGKVLGGDTITESGILAAAHLAGPGNVKRYFMHGHNFSDAYGTKLTKYLHTFSGYDIKIN